MQATGKPKMAVKSTKICIRHSRRKPKDKPLLSTLVAAEHVSLMKLVLNKGFGPQVRVAACQVALTKAAPAGYVEMVDLLIEEGFDEPLERHEACRQALGLVLAGYQSKYYHLSRDANRRIARIAGGLVQKGLHPDLRLSCLLEVLAADNDNTAVEGSGRTLAAILKVLDTEERRMLCEKYLNSNPHPSPWRLLAVFNSTWAVAKNELSIIDEAAPRLSSTDQLSP